MINNVSGSSRSAPLVRLLAFLLFLYLFLISIQLMGSGLSHAGRGLAETLIAATTNPFNGLVIGLLATALVQSSSFTTSIAVGMVAAGALPMEYAVPIVIGANMGTTVTNTIVSLGHIGHREVFSRAFAASVVHDVFNLLTVAVVFPLQYWFGFLERAAGLLSVLAVGSMGAEFASPLKAITQPLVDIAARWMGHNPWLLVAAALALLFVSLAMMVRHMRRLIMESAERVLDRTVFRTPLRGLLFGMILTGVVQSSSVTTSLLVPLAGAGVLKLEKVLPFTMGANIGTTITAMLASLATGNPDALALAFSHLLFNICGIAVFWWMPFIPTGIARRMASFAAANRSLAIGYVILLFFVLPALALYLLH